MKKLTIRAGLPWVLLTVWALQCGSGNTLAATRLGGSPTALAIDGPGWFVVRDPVSDEHFVTRCGDFFLDEAGRLGNQEGYLVQGFVDVASRVAGDVTIEDVGPPISYPWSPVLGFLFQPDGTLIVQREDGTEFIAGQILLQDFRRPEMLMRNGLRIYSPTDAAGSLVELGPPGSSGLGSLKTNLVEFEEARWSVLPEARRGVRWLPAC